MPQPGSCALMHPNLCPNATNVARGRRRGHRATHHKYQPPLEASIDADDVVCTDKDWTQATGPTCAKECARPRKKPRKVAAVFYPLFMSLPVAHPRRRRGQGGRPRGDLPRVGPDARSRARILG